MFLNPGLKNYIIGSSRSVSISSAWTPSNLDSLAAWFDASDNETISLNGSNVSQWSDKSENNKHAVQETAVEQPAQDTGDKSINFNYDSLDIPNTNANSFIAVFRNKSTNESSNSLLGITSAANSMRFKQYNTFELYGSTGSIAINGSALFPVNNAGSDIYFTGYSPIPNRNECDMLYGQINTSVAFQFIGGIPSTNNYGIFDLHELILCSAQLSESDRQKLEGYLAHKWSMASKLPLGHPYKINPPSI